LLYFTRNDSVDASDCVGMLAASQWRCLILLSKIDYFIQLTQQYRRRQVLSDEVAAYSKKAKSILTSPFTIQLFNLDKYSRDLTTPKARINRRSRKAS